MGKSSPSGTTNTIQKSDPWSGQQPYLTNVFQNAAQLYGSGPWTSYPGQTVAPIQPQTYQSLGLEQARALSGSPVTSSAQNYDTNLFSGNYLSAGNPYFQNMVGQVGQSIMPQIQSNFALNGRTGSGAEANAFADALTREAGQLAFQNYGQERGLQNQALWTAPTLANQDYQDISALGDVGSQLQNLQQGYINADINRFTQTQQLPYQQLAQYSSLIGNPVMPGTTSTQQPFFTNPLGSAMQFGLGSLGIANGLNNLGLLSGAGKGAAAAAAAAPAAIDTASSLGPLLTMGLAA